MIVDTNDVGGERSAETRSSLALRLAGKQEERGNGGKTLPARFVSTWSPPQRSRTRVASLLAVFAWHYLLFGNLKAFSPRKGRIRREKGDSKEHMDQFEAV